MYAYYTAIKTSLRSDDIAGARAIYSNGGVRANDLYDDANTSFSTAGNLTAQIDPTALTALVTNLDNENASGNVEYFTFTAPAATTATFTVSVQSSGLSLFAPAMTVYAADQATVLGTASGAGQYGTTLTVTVNGVSAGQQFYVKVAGADTSVFSGGKYAMTINFGSAGSPTVPLPNTQTVNGSQLSGGGGIAFMPNAQNGNQNKQDNLTIQGYNSILQGGGCGCPLCTAAANARQAQQMMVFGLPSSRPADPDAQSLDSLGDNAQNRTVKGLVGANPTSSDPGSALTISRSAVRTLQSGNRAEESGTGVRSGSE